MAPMRTDWLGSVDVAVGKVDCDGGRGMVLVVGGTRKPDVVGLRVISVEGRAGPVVPARRMVVVYVV